MGESIGLQFMIIVIYNNYHPFIGNTFFRS